MFCLNDYDCIGFDLDCTIAEYNKKALLRLIYELMAEYLIQEKNYSSDFLLKPLEEIDYFLQKGLFLDLKKGNILKIDENGLIVKAAHGTRFLSDKEIHDMYGINKTFNVIEEFIQDPLSIINTPYEKLLRASLDCFDMPCIFLYARAVDQLDSINGAVQTEYNIWPDILEGLYKLYNKNNFFTGESKFFSELKKNPSLYYKQCTPEKLAWLKEAKSQKFVFLLTGSFIDFASLTASFCLGENWKDYFDIVLCYARKPFFFFAGRPFLEVVGTEERALEGRSLRLNSVYSQGNWEELKALISKERKVKEPKCLYIGDNLIQDVYSPHYFRCCDTVAVSKELTNEYVSNCSWDSYFKIDDKLDSYWNHLIINHAKICVSDLDALSKRPFSYQYHCLKRGATNELCEFNGYYTN